MINSSKSTTNLCFPTQANKLPLSFTSADDLRQKIHSMPGPPKWQECTIHFKEAPNEPVVFRWRDFVESAAYIMQNRTFEGDMDYSPRRLFDGDVRVYDEVCTGNDWWAIQVSIPSLKCSGILGKGVRYLLMSFY